MKILLLRHAEAIGNREQRMLGQLDTPLSAWGHQQAMQLGQTLAQVSWPPTHIYCSLLQRSRQTAEILRRSGSDRSGCPTIQTVNTLQEIHNGIFQGLTWPQAQARYPDLCTALERSPTWMPIPEAESLVEVRDRAHNFIQMLLTGHRDRDRIWGVTHGGLLPYLIAELLGSPKVWGVEIASLALFEFEVNLTYWQNADQNAHNPTLWQIHRFNQCLV